MKSNDVKNKTEIKEVMQRALAENNAEMYTEALKNLMECIAEEVKEEVKQEYDTKIENLKQEYDSSVLSTRGVRQLTSLEKAYYQKVKDAMKSPDPKLALDNIGVTMPETVIESVFEDLRGKHELLSHIGFTPTGGAIKMLLNTDGQQEAQWGTLTAEIAKELVSGFKEVDTGLLKLAALVPVAKSMLELGAEWLDRYIREILYEALANGLESGIVKGDGNKKPIGMTRQVGEDVVVTGGVYPEKEKITVNDLSTGTIGNLLNLIAVTENGKSRVVDDVILIVNPQDYFQRVMPATTIMAPDGTYRNDVLPYPITVIQSAALERGEAVIGLGKKYFAAVGMEQGGRIEFSDHCQFVEDNRVYTIKMYANGFAMDNNAFLHLDISGLKPMTYKVELIEAEEPSTDATLSNLKIGSLTLSPTFAAATTTYTTSTTAATNTVTATPADAGAEIVVKIGNTEINNGSAATWATGENTVTVKVTAADGTTTKTYTVTVTKS